VVWWNYFSVFLIGWAVGGVLFGVLADRFGNTKVLIFTILIYAVFGACVRGCSLSRWKPKASRCRNNANRRRRRAW
jgi:MFS family permease